MALLRSSRVRRRWPGGVLDGRWATALALILLAAYGFHVRWALLTASPYPLGVDGYFYPIQLRALLESGQLYYPASPLAFWLMAPLAWLADPITGAKLGAALAGAAVVWPAYALGRRLGGGRLPGLCAAVVAVASTGSLLLSAEFVKNAFGVTFGLAALAALLAALDDEGAGSRRRWMIAAVALVAALLTHKMAAALVLVLGGPPLVVVLWRRWPARRGALVIAGVVSAAALAVLGVVAPGRFLSPAHLELGSGLFSGAWRWDAPALVVGSFELPLGGEAWKAGLVSALAAAALIAERALQPRRARAGTGAESAGGAAVAAWLILALSLLLACPALAVEDPQGLGFRLRLIAFAPLALSAAIFVGVAARLLAPRLLLGARLVLLVALAAHLCFAPTRLQRGVVYAHPAMIAAVCALRSAELPQGATVVVSERHIAFMATWYARLSTSVRRDAGAPATRYRLMPLAFIGTSSPLARAIAVARARTDIPAPRGLHPKHENGLVLMPEITWRFLLTQLPEKPRRYYESWRAL